MAGRYPAGAYAAEREGLLSTWCLQEGWLCFHAVRSRLSPIFEPFTGKLQLGPGGALCAKETDESVDLLFRLNPKLAQGPERWGAQFIFKPEKEAANTRGRFLHSFS